MQSSATQLSLPALPLADWKDSKMTLHLILQIIGKVKLQFMPRKNHWWYITEHISAKGFSTRSIPFGQEVFEINLNIKDSRVEIISSWADDIQISLKDGNSVAEFYQLFCMHLREIGVEVDIIPQPFDLPIQESFGKIKQYHHWDLDSITKFWKIMLWVDGVFKEFSGRYYGKTCPVHLYWHHMDLTVTRFSGRKAPPMDAGASVVEKDAYSHEVISFGFWAGDDNTPAPAFYSYTYPSPEGLGLEKLSPATAQWIDANGSPMALLMYDEIRELENPEEALLSFLESAYQAGAKLAHWNVEELSVPGLREM
ncbi:hypothetical protein OKW21_003459 [Catalinimonas alkaloidigena]|uniref:DUF5996 family protein n=1 Tax=Catalinimonas alkaloidigena TaxID=1075417 RepID=UPI0024058ACD|nr:DUF5996 family protein [Catalinimonas alkaloidigena]MDF9798196.1 hypothetical protein [Catalinimonas alkaloidigena]